MFLKLDAYPLCTLNIETIIIYGLKSLKYSRLVYLIRIILELYTI